MHSTKCSCLSGLRALFGSALSSATQVATVEEGEHLYWSADASRAVFRAWYGDVRYKWQQGPGLGMACHEAVKMQLRSMDCVFAVNDLLGKDPCPGVSKVLLIEHSGRNRPEGAYFRRPDASRFLTLKEGQSMRWSSAAGDRVSRAWYGTPQALWQYGDARGVDCTKAVVSQLRRTDRIAATNDMVGADPCPGKGKLLIIEYRGADPPDMATGRKLFTTAAEVPSGPRWIAFIRHAQAGHNVDESLIETPDNGLTDFGRQQAVQAATGLPGFAVRAADLVITSPLKRALQTTHLLVGDAKVRIRVDALCTERRGAPCDAGTLKCELMAQLPRECGLSWEGWDELPERWWPEPGEDMWGRAERFTDMLRQRPEDRIAVVGHGAFWQMVTGAYLPNCEVRYCDRSLSG